MLIATPPRCHRPDERLDLRVSQAGLSESSRSPGVAAHERVMVLLVSRR
ncbi:hypothetical protein PAMC26510_02675 [Caballeronia sordidicola]|uniref:Uncharacterized protein n=1 Tax=Caballeronia sordidicola TaxID=196367 RepID=A0A242NA72_CABSO|nr:hypothetical protein PAMC26510_02675 [Caballeronia sordidicola]